MIFIFPVTSIILISQAQENHVRAFNRFIRAHPQWKKAVSKKIDIEELFVAIEESALIYSMHTLKI